jgi:high-affinity iron transporter
MFSAALIVFRETLEAALIIGIIGAATRGLPGRNFWMLGGVIAGLAGSLGVAALTEVIAQLAEGSGQELFNAMILGAAVLMLAWHSIWMNSHGRELAQKARAMGNAVREGQRGLSALALVIALAVLREGSETVLFLNGMLSGGADAVGSVLGGGLLGLAAGAALGLVMYQGLVRIPMRWFFGVTNLLLLLLAAGLASQMAKFLIQADLLPSLATPLWDSSAWLPVDTLHGATLHVLIGYDAQPSGMQFVFYVATLGVISLASLMVKYQAARTPERVATA